MRLNTEEYNAAEGCLKRYNYNCISIINIRTDLMSIGSPKIDGLPKAPYVISDEVYNTVIKIEEDENLQKHIKEYRVVRQALELVNDDCKEIFEKLYVLKKSKWKIIEEGISERTFGRRKKELIYAVHKELKKMA